MKIVNDYYWKLWADNMVHQCYKDIGISVADVAQLYDRIKVHSAFNETIQTTNVSSRYVISIIYSPKRESYKFTICNILTGQHGSAICSKGDSFNSFVATAIAFARYCKCVVPVKRTYLTFEEIKELKSGTVIYDNYNDCEFIYVGLNPFREREVFGFEKDVNTLPFSYEYYPDRFFVNK